MIFSMKIRGTNDRLERVAENLFRDSVTRMYYGKKKVNGKRKVHSLDTTDRKLADRKLAKWLGETVTANPEAVKKTLADVVKQYREERQGLSDSSHKCDTMVIKQIESARTKDGGPFVFDLTARFSAITPAQIALFMGRMKKRGISDRSYNLHALVLSAIFEIAERDGIVTENAYKKAKVKWMKLKVAPIRTPTLEEFDAILTAIRTNKFNRTTRKPCQQSLDAGDFVEFEGRAALGQAETYNLFGKHVHLEEGYMNIKRQKTGVYYDVPIYPNLRPLLERMRAERGGEFAPEERVFKIKDAKGALDSACERLGLPAFTQRNLRQMAIKNMLKLKLDVKLISKWQGHGDGGKLVLERYTRGVDGADADYQKQELAKLAAKASSPQNSPHPHPESAPCAAQGSGA